MCCILPCIQNMCLWLSNNGHCMFNGNNCFHLFQYMYTYIYHIIISFFSRELGNQKNHVKGLRSGESTGLRSMWPGLDSQTRRHIWVEFVGSPLYTERCFFWYSGFPLSSKTKTLIWSDLRWFGNFNLHCSQFSAPALERQDTFSKYWLHPPFKVLQEALI